MSEAKLILGDCLSVLPTLEAGFVLVTDPPYGVDFAGKATKHTTKKPGGYTSTDDAAVGPAAVRMAMANAVRGAVFPGNRNLQRYPEAQDIGCVYCPSGAGIGPWGFCCFHPVLFYGKRATNVLNPASIRSFATAESNGHPCPKPLEWMLWVVGLVANEGETIVDPFMGSGTTGIAALQHGCNFIGIERDPTYFAIAEKRIAAERRNLFAGVS